MEEPKVIKVKKLPKANEAKAEIDETTKLLAKLCYYYPQYTLRDSRKLPYKHVIILLRIAEELKAMEYINLLQIAIAPHTKQGGKRLMEHFTKMMNHK